MTIQEARTLKDDQLKAEISDLRRKLYTLRTQTVTEKVEDNSAFAEQVQAAIDAG